MSQVSDSAAHFRKLLAEMTKPDWKRKDVHALLDAALDLADAGGDVEGEAGQLSQAAALTLSRAVAGWMVPVERPDTEWDGLAATDPEAWREAVIERLRLTYALPPQRVIDILMFALTDLQGGRTPGFLQPSPRDPGYGKDPISRHHFEQALLTWIEMEKARGKRARQAQEEVAFAIERSAAPFQGVPAWRTTEPWLRDWRARHGKDHVKTVLSQARALARGKKLAPPFSAELTLIRFMAMAEGGLLKALADGWKAARS